jgi:hypothetical protein
MSKSLVVMCRGSALAAEVLAYGTVFAYLIIIYALSLSRHPGGYLFMTTLPPCCHHLDKGAAGCRPHQKHVSARSSNRCQHPLLSHGSLGDLPVIP